jgi:circadian clock protein KaiC
MNREGNEPYQPERVQTGIAGLDDILGGGFPKSHLYLIEGGSGVGKTTLGLQFLLEGIRRGESCLWITMSETERDLRETSRSHGWSLENLEICNLAVSEASLQADSQYSFFSPSDIELSDTTRAVIETVDRVRPTRLVFDPFSDMRLLARDPLRYRRQVLALREYFSNRGCTVLLMQDAAEGTSSDPQAEGLLHGFHTLNQFSPAYGGVRRRLRVHKLRGVPFRDGYHDFTIRTGGLVVFPRLIAAEHYDEGPEEIFSSQIPQLDSLMGGGLDRGGSLLIMGPAGVGKSTLSTQYAAAAVMRGEHAALFLFDETVRTFCIRGERLGMSVREAIQTGRMAVRQVDPTELSPGEFSHIVRQAVEEKQARLVVIDSLNGYLTGMPEESQLLPVQLHELFTYLSHRGVLTILTLEQHGILGEGVRPPVNISYLADTVILLRYFEAMGAVRRAISVVKKRTGPHEDSIRELRIGKPNGIRVGEALEEFEGVLTGRPDYTGGSGRLAKREHGTTQSAGE